VDLGALKFTAEVDEADIDRVKVDQTAIVTLDALPGKDIKTTVRRINPAAQQTATGGTVFAVELAIEQTPLEILIGMKGDAEIEVSSVGAAITIPVEALFSEGGTDYVYVYEGGKLKKTEITVGATTDTEVEVVEGLKPGQEVALSGSTQYTDGMAVRPKAK
jgi:RND family efflux transporter MFP subunit